MMCGWLKADLAEGSTPTTGPYKSEILAGRVRDLCHEATQRGEASELIVAALEMAEHHEAMARASRRCDGIIHEWVKRSEREE